MARALGLILVPVVLYVSVFYVHLILLNRSGMSSKAVSPAFQIDFLDGFFGSNDTMPRGMFLFEIYPRLLHAAQRNFHTVIDVT